MASAALAASLALGGCYYTDAFDGYDGSNPALTPIPDALVQEMAQLGMTKEAPILVRIFKEEAELEVWKEDHTGRYALLKTYPICRWSGELGPKIREGDRQAPEGFYKIAPAQMNPDSNYYLAFNLGYPNAYDRAHGRTGAHLMVHGDCSSRGCYAVTDEQIGEIYALARESFFAGQEAFQVQAFPFRMTPQNMARHRNNPNMPFWRMLKEGYDHFEVSRYEPKVDVCEKRYVFNAFAPDYSDKPLKFRATDKCPAYQVPADLVAALSTKQVEDDVRTTSLVRRGTPAAPIRTGLDGGTNPVFLTRVANSAYLPPPAVETPASVPAAARVEPASVATTASIDGEVPLPRQSPLTRPGSTTALAATEGPDLGQRISSMLPTGQRARGVFDRVAGLVGLRGSSTDPEPAPPPAAATPPAPRLATTTSRTVTLKPQPPRPVARIPASKPATVAAAKPKVDESDDAPSAPTLMSGATPVVPTGTFDSRWGALR